MLKSLPLLFFLLFFSLNAVSQNAKNNRIYEVWDSQPAPNRGKDYSVTVARGFPFDRDWETYSYPIGNGYMGANIFGRTDTERIQITEKTLTNGAPYGTGGMTNFAEIFLQFNHYNISNYKRSINLNDGTAYVSYDHKDVTYTREYFASYPDNIIAIRLSANKSSKISLTVRAEIPYLRGKDELNNSRGTITKIAKSGKINTSENQITLSGSIPSFSLNYEGQIKIINDGGQLLSNSENGTKDISIVDANTVTILIATSTNYKLNKNIFLQDSTQLKLDPKVFPHDKVSKIIKEASSKTYQELKETHLKDYQNLFSRVQLKLTKNQSTETTSSLVENYKDNATNPYLEELMFHFGRYLLIASSRKGTLPCGLQGTWSQYHVTPWSGGYWHNINIQMNYWGAFNANLAETFLPYEQYFEAYLPKAFENGSTYIKTYYPEKFNENPHKNGWCIGTGANAYSIGVPGGHSGPGTGGFTTKLFWDRFEYTQDTTYLKNIAYPALLGMSTFLSKTLEPKQEGILLVDRSFSPEQIHNGKYYETKGSTFDQGFVWETYNDLLKSAKILDLNTTFLNRVKKQIKKLDPILIGESGQIKEFREEKTYGEIGDPKHRHISHLCTIFPGTLINSNHPDWMKAASTVLNYRGNETTGWAMAHRMNIYARTKEAEKAHDVYSKFLRERTNPNLWTKHPPFQIDGNLGTMAGVAEMLIQSHEGLIELLPALPKAWKNGSFKGLMARGNFEIDLKWTNGEVTYTSVLSKIGGTCRVKYKNINRVKIKDKSGKIVPIKQLSDDVISFNTKALSKYIINF
ncbi:glycosyl hydrolase family 95 catalytic domain-containing protein [Aestuariibaculum sediminum]|uniref:Glycoside hydrolase family 95 protein n=1 Tax=Aestuariibaculum sediminum TaxID=2770637 RepID=A0A8J6Q868_9FLAO|nr:glycoside hydrolase N-terminal domain-containing protein [Aestuariibaculum sediminum]MBD0832385.1 glycoside hydrolase family 95 protein [Aestuariibaculum sediminum]